MIARPGFSADEGVPLAAGLPDSAPAALTATVSRVRGWGGRVAVYQGLLGRLLAAGPGLDGQLRSAAVLAAWRSGVVRLRAEALAALSALEPATAELVLWLPPGSVAGFARAQLTDPFALPGSAQLVAIVGGFRGFGGPWAAPPAEARSVAPGRFSVRTGALWWSLRADAFGAQLWPLEADPPGENVPSLVSAVVSPESYLVRLVRDAP